MDHQDSKHSELEFTDKNLLNGQLNEIINYIEPQAAQVERDKLINFLIEDYFLDDENLLNGKNVLHITTTQLSEDEEQITIGNQFYNTLFQYLIEIKINHITKRLIMTSTLVELDGSPIYLPQMIIKSLLRYSLRLNCQLRLGAFSINPRDGNLSFKVATSFKNHEYERQNGKQDFNRHFKSIHSTSLYSLGYQMVRFAILINKINILCFTDLENYLKELYNNSRSMRKLPDGALSTLIEIQELINYKMCIEMTSEEKLKKQKYFNFPKPNQNYYLEIMNEIILHKNENTKNWESIPFIKEGGFAQIKKIQIKYATIQQPDLLLNRNLAMKSSISKENNALKTEIKTLQDLSKEMTSNSQFKGYCPFLAQTYYSKKIEFQDIYFMEFYQYLSLDNFKLKFNSILSLSSKLYILNCIAQGLKYIHDCGFVHMDIKPGNILMSKTWIPKICDFGEARKIEQKEIKIKQIGRTLPYAPPEVYDQALTLTTAYDIYSYGMLMFEFIFDKFPIVFFNCIQDIPRNNLSELENQLITKQYKLQYNVDYNAKSGPQYIINHIAAISLKCLDPEPKNRPKLEWIIIILREMLSYLDKMY